MQAVEVMTHICRESEASLDYYSLFRAIMKRTPQPMSPLESLASSAVRTAHKVSLWIKPLLESLHLRFEMLSLALLGKPNCVSFAPLQWV